MTAPTTPEQAAGKTSGDEKSRYRGTLNLPQTSFPMKANLVQNEAASIKRWEGLPEGGLYVRLRKARAGRDGFVFHDGPPYANGSLHLGHLLNRVLKDLVVRTRSMAGLDCPFVPGWDCHGLPIEHKVVTDLMQKGKYDKLAALPEEQRRMAIRRECQANAEKDIKVQASQMVRLLTLADYAHPYKTMSREFEGAVLEVLAALLEQGLVYRALKPVHWSVANETALAEAELEYMDREDISVYVDFEAESAAAVYEVFGLKEENAEDAEPDAEVPGSDVETEESSTKSRIPEPGVRPNQTPSFMIWTTTPWTLPANLAIAVNPKFTYALVWVDGNVAVLAADAVERVTKAAKAETVRVLATTTGDRLVGLRYRHPFVEHAPEGATAPVFRVVPAEYVTLEDGTGLVHTAPGHGTEDYQTGLREGLPIYCPVLGNGRYDDRVPDWLRGVDIWKANEAIVQRLRESGHLFFDHKFVHSYPHDWRGKTPVIFRCTEQWFVSVDRPTRREGRPIRELSVAAAGDRVRFVPEWGRNRMRGMLESRPDWCISRQRAWGLPIPAFFWRDAGGADRAFMTPASSRAVAKLVREKGSDCWFSGTPEQLLAHYDASADPDAPPELKDGTLRSASMTKGPDILDVWFESGSSWNAVIRERTRAAGLPEGQNFPTDLYLEGSDQHRGWFQSAILTSLGATGLPPYRTLLTHGFMVDKDGRKMSKSLGNTLEVEDLLKEFGADVCRWWVASLSYENDIKVDKSYFAIAGESYRKVRNTLRFLLSNLYDYKGDAPVSFGARTLEAWVLAEFDRAREDVVRAYEAYDFQTAQKRLYDFCNDTLSATYLAAIKDRLYCDKPDAPRRRRTQAALHALADGLCRLLAPILCHTADEAFRVLRNTTDADCCVHLEEFLAPSGVAADAAWGKVFAARERALQAMEKARGAPGERDQRGLGVENPLDMGVVLPDPDRLLAPFDAADLADLLGVSRVTLDPGAQEPRVQDLRSEPRCERSWKRDGTVRKRSDGGMLSDRDAAAVGAA